jgi:hypothetical protein
MINRKSLLLLTLMALSSQTYGAQKSSVKSTQSALNKPAYIVTACAGLSWLGAFYYANANKTLAARYRQAQLDKDTKGIADIGINGKRNLIAMGLLGGIGFVLTPVATWLWFKNGTKNATTK